MSLRVLAYLRMDHRAQVPAEDPQRRHDAEGNIEEILSNIFVKVIIVYV